MLFRIHSAAGEAIFVQLADQVRAAVADGTLSAGERLPAARDLAKALDVSLHTVLHAYQDLRDEGLIELRRGRGAVVADHPGRDFTDLNRAIAAVVTESRRLDLAPDTTLALVKEALA